MTIDRSEFVAGGVAVDGYVRLSDVVRETGTERNTLRRQLYALGIALWESPQDRRERLLRVEDVETLRRPRLARRGRTASKRQAVPHVVA